MLALASVLSLLRPPKGVVRFAITAAELLTRSAGAYACEAALGWVEPAELSDEVVQAAQATAASLGARQRRCVCGPQEACGVCHQPTHQCVSVHSCNTTYSVYRSGSAICLVMDGTLSSIACHDT